MLQAAIGAMRVSEHFGKPQEIVTVYLNPGRKISPRNQAFNDNHTHHRLPPNLKVCSRLGDTSKIARVATMQHDI
jgi:hypothetical protein